MFSTSRYPQRPTTNAKSASDQPINVPVWQVEDALHALRQAEIRLQQLEHSHAREKEELYLIIAAHEHSTTQSQSSEQRIRAEIKAVKQQSQQELEAAKKFVAQNELAMQKLQLKSQESSERLQVIAKKQDSKLQKQAILVSDLSGLCDQQEAQLDEAQETIERLQAVLKSTEADKQAEIDLLNQQLHAQEKRLTQAQEALDDLTSNCSQKDSDLSEALRLCDEFESKLIRTSEEFEGEKSSLKQSLTVLEDTARQQELRAAELEKAKTELEERFSVQLADMSAEAEQKSQAAQNQYETQIGSLQSTIDHLEAQAKQRAEEVDQLSGKILQLNSDYAEKFAAAQQRIQDEVTRASGQHHEEIERLQSVIGNLEEKVHSTAQKASESQIEANQLRQQCDSLKQKSAEEDEKKRSKISALAETIRKNQERIKEEKLQEAKKLKVRVGELEVQRDEADRSRFKVQTRSTQTCQTTLGAPRRPRQATRPLL